MKCPECNADTIFWTEKVEYKPHIDIIKCSKCEKYFEYNWQKCRIIRKRNVKHKIEII